MGPGEHVKNEGYLRAIVALLSTPQECSTAVRMRAKSLQMLENERLEKAAPGA